MEGHIDRHGIIATKGRRPILVGSITRNVQQILVAVAMGCSLTIP